MIDFDSSYDYGYSFTFQFPCYFLHQDIWKFDINILTGKRDNIRKDNKHFLNLRFILNGTITE